MELLGVKHLPLCHLQFPFSSFKLPAINHHSFSPQNLPFQPHKFPKIGITKQRLVASEIHCSSNSVQFNEGNAIVKEKSVSVILLAGGKGTRMGASMPKQYLPLMHQPIALYSLYTFSQMVEVKEIVVVCDPSYRDIFEGAKEKIQVDLKFTEPGKERQDSVFSGLQESRQEARHRWPLVQGSEGPKEYGLSCSSAVNGDQTARVNGLTAEEVLITVREEAITIAHEQSTEAIDSNAELVCIHDSARPLVSSQDIDKVLKDAWLHGAAVLGVPAKATIKEANSDRFVVKTLDRKTLWEMQTPQVIKPALLKEGFDLVNRKGLEVTDDVSIVEHLNHPVYITEGSYTNIKITTPDDLIFAERIMNPSSSH
ncbi:hypothetical protein KSS87_002691 [Heliosperma pusillum]|nr:hypothetical protein KSS87_002691 [Heliosperma pusillum]